MRASGEEVVDTLGVGTNELLVEGTSRQRGPIALEVGSQA
jgi:hypothetical protein